MPIEIPFMSVIFGMYTQIIYAHMTIYRNLNPNITKGQKMVKKGPKKVRNGKNLKKLPTTFTFSLVLRWVTGGWATRRKKHVALSSVVSQPLLHLYVCVYHHLGRGQEPVKSLLSRPMKQTSTLQDTFAAYHLLWEFPGRCQNATPLSTTSVPSPHGPWGSHLSDCVAQEPVNLKVLLHLSPTRLTETTRQLTPLCDRLLV